MPEHAAPRAGPGEAADAQAGAKADGADLRTPDLRTPDLRTPDAPRRSTVELLPGSVRPYARLARFDRPIGIWLLFWPCAWGVALAGGLPRDGYLLLLFLIGATAMRGAGCVYNDIVDRDLDARVARTRDRPIPSGRVSVRAAWLWLVLLSLVGLCVLLQLPALAQEVALLALLLVAAYPFMKRVTWWPQAWLGLTFNWGVLVGWAASQESLPWAAWLLYAAGVAWTLAYDSIYALQDVEDDALAGIRSSARRMGRHVWTGVALFFAAMFGLLAAAVLVAHPDPLALAALLPAALHAAGQLSRLRLAMRSSAGSVGPAVALGLFRSNHLLGLLVFAACLVVGTA